MGSARARLLIEHGSDRTVGVLNMRRKLTMKRFREWIVDAWSVVFNVVVPSWLTAQKADNDHTGKQRSGSFVDVIIL